MVSLFVHCCRYVSKKLGLIVSKKGGDGAKEMQHFVTNLSYPATPSIPLSSTIPFHSKLTDNVIHPRT